MTAPGASSLQRALELIDAANAEDPRRELVDGVTEPAELRYSRRMSAVLAELYPRAGEELEIAVRAQHLCRWRIPRDRFPQDRTGYRRWRRELGQLHARLAQGLCLEAGYEQQFASRVGQLIRKEHLSQDPEAQALEDVACVVFLRYAFEEFAAKHDEQKLREILRKTWAKMSPVGQSAAAGVPLPDRLAQLVQDAVKGT